MVALSASQSRAADSTSVSQHGLQIEGRAADDLEHVGGGGLLLQRFAQLVEQPRVLDGDDGLGGEVLDQFDLLVGERSDLLTIDGDGTDQFIVLEHRDAKTRAMHRRVRPQQQRTDRLRCSLCSDMHIGNVSYLLCVCTHVRKAALGGGYNGSRRALPDNAGGALCMRPRRESHRPRRGKVHRTWPRRCATAFSSMASNTGCKLARRAADDLEHLRGRGLLLSRSRASSLSSRVFSMAMTA